MKIISLILTLIFLLTLVSYVNANERKEITINESGFSPSELSIKVGEGVTFINNGQQEHWPASNIHPSHGIYSEFDPQKALKPGERWNFVFNKPGMWGMHDHLNSEKLGRIIVEGNVSHSKTINFDEWNLNNFIFMTKVFIYKTIPFLNSHYFKTTNFSSISHQIDQEKLKFIASIYPEDLVAQKLLNEVKKNPKIDCHFYAHKYGYVYYELNGLNFFKHVSNSCQQGFVHGAIEAYLSENHEDDFGQKVEKLCYGSKTSYEILECIHGVGHGIMVASNYDLPHAIELCKKLSTPENSRLCTGGAFMENVTTALGVGAGNPHQIKWISTEPNFPCNQYLEEPEYAYQCYWIQTAWMAKLFSQDYNMIGEVCAKLNGTPRNGCFRGMGRQAAYYKDPNIILEKCEIAKNTGIISDYKECILGGTFVIFDNFGPNVKDQPQHICAAIKENEVKKSCYKQLAVRLKSALGDNSSRLTEECSYFEPEFRSFCL